MILLTMGTYPLPFDRMVEAVDVLMAKKLVEEQLFAQIGCCRYVPKHMEYARIMEKEHFDKCLQSASALIGHAGMGTITLALENHKPLLVMPRLKIYKEHVNDHQVGTAREFERMGHVLAAYSVDELPEKVPQLKTFVPKPRTAQPEAVAERIRRFLDEIAGK